MTNSESPKAQKLPVKVIFAFLAGVAIVFFLVSTVVDARLSELQLETRELIARQEAQLSTIAEVIARNGADEVTERIIQDCSSAERTQFDQLLGSLNNGLPRAQLVELERLFGRCGNFYAERKAVMVSRFNREIQIYETFVRQLENLQNVETLPEYNVSAWKELSELESKQSELFGKLVNVQDEVITLLLLGNAATSNEVTTILQEANEIQETLLVTRTQAAAVRSGLVSI